MSRTTTARKLNRTDALAFVRGQQWPEGWKVKVLERKDNVLIDGGCYSQHFHDACVAIVHVQPSEDVTCEFRFCDRAGWRGDGPGWRVSATFRRPDKDMPNGVHEFKVCDVVHKGQNKRRGSGIVTTENDAIAHVRSWYRGRMLPSTVNVTPVKRQTANWNGTTQYKVGGHTYSFDRRGVEDSFYGDDQDTPDLVAAVRVQAARAAEAKARIERSTPIPDGFGFMVTPETREQITATLRSGRSRSFTPSGFGTGKMLHPKRVSGSVESPAIARFFNVPEVYITTFDAD